MILEVNMKFQTFQLPLKNPALKLSVPLCYVINLCLKDNMKHKLHLLRVESCMRLLTVNHFNFIAVNQVLRRLKDVFRGVPYEPPLISATVQLCYTFELKWHSFLPPHCLGTLQKKSYTGVIHNSVDECQRVGLAIRWSRVRVPLWSFAGFVLCCPEIKSSATLVNSQLVASCQLGFTSCYVVFELFVF